MKDAADVVAAAHVADGHEVGAHHAGQFGAWPRLSDLAQAAQSIMSIMQRGGGVHVDGRHGATFMKLESDSGVGLTPELLRYVGACGAVNGRAVATSASAVRKSDVVLPEAGRFQHHTPVR